MLTEAKPITSPGDAKKTVTDEEAIEGDKPIVPRTINCHEHCEWDTNKKHQGGNNTGKNPKFRSGFSVFLMT